MNAIDYINFVGGEWAQLLALLFAGLLLILKVGAGVKTVLPDLWVPQKTARLADYDLDERSMMAPEFQEFNEMRAFKRIWGIRAGLSLGENIIQIYIIVVKRVGMLEALRVFNI